MERNFITPGFLVVVESNKPIPGLHNPCKSALLHKAGPKADFSPWLRSSILYYQITLYLPRSDQVTMCKISLIFVESLTKRFHFLTKVAAWGNIAFNL